MGCQEVKRPEKPDNLIPKETMVALLTEIYLGNSARSIDNKRIREQGVKLDSFLFATYNVDSLQFAKSNAYYTADINTYNEIFNEVHARLEKFKEVENARKLEINARKRAKADSIKSNKTSTKEELDTIQQKQGLIDPVTEEEQ